jgi:hypothetical protein
MEKGAFEWDSLRTRIQSKPLHATKSAQRSSYPKSPIDHPDLLVLFAPTPSVPHRYLKNEYADDELLSLSQKRPPP